MYKRQPHDGAAGGDPTIDEASNSALPERATQGSQLQSRRRTRRHRHGKSGKAKRPASWSNRKRIASALTQDISCVEDWDEEIEEEARRNRAAAAAAEAATIQLPESEEENWDAPEAQTDPGNGLTWDEMIPKDPVSYTHLTLPTTPYV